MLEAVDVGVLKEFFERLCEVQLAVEVLKELFEKVEELQAAVEVLRENQEEILERLANLSTPGVDYEVREGL